MEHRVHQAENRVHLEEGILAVRLESSVEAENLVVGHQEDHQETQEAGLPFQERNLEELLLDPQTLQSLVHQHLQLVLEVPQVVRGRWSA